MPELRVDPESGVKFRISREPGDPGICLLIHIDNTLFPVVEADVPRPDYLALYLHGDGCLCTIIEMKSRDEKKLKHGLMQIKALADRLKQEFGQLLPGRFRLEVQGLLLCAENAQVPGPAIEAMTRSGLTILPAKCQSRAELYPYISQKHDLKKGFVNKPRHPDVPSPLEALLSRDSLHTRVSLTELGTSDAPRKPPFHICYAASDALAEVTWTVQGKCCVLQVREEGTALADNLRGDVERNGLSHKFQVKAL